MAGSARWRHRGTAVLWSSSLSLLHSHLLPGREGQGRERRHCRVQGHAAESARGRVQMHGGGGGRERGRGHDRGWSGEDTGAWRG